MARVARYMHRFKMFIVGLAVVIGGGCAIAWFAYLSGNPLEHVETNVSDESNRLASTDKLIIDFSRPVNRSSFRLHLEPALEGEIRFEKPLLNSHLYRRAVFTPLYGWRPGTQYRVALSGVRNAVGGTSETGTQFVFSTKEPPRVTDIEVQGEEGNVSITPVVTITLDQPNDVVELLFDSQPAVDWNVSASANNTVYTLHTPTPLRHDTTYQLSVYGMVALHDNAISSTSYRGDRWLMGKQRFHTRGAYSVKKWSPTGISVDVHTPITIDFGTRIDTSELRDETIIQIFPETFGVVQWNDSGTLMRFLPTQPWKPNTLYTVELGRDICFSRQESASRVECRFAFQTAGPVKVSSVFPTNGLTGVDANSAIRLTFDQDVDRASAQERFSLEPSVEGNFSWDETTLIFRPRAPLALDTRYIIVVEPGVKGFLGYELERRVEVPFSTQGSTTVLDIEIDYQDRALSCEAATLKMALTQFGINVSENDIMDIVGYDPTPHKGDVWGDPHKAFVGNIDGKQNTTGYGVYWEPIARAARAWRPDSVHFTGWTLEQALRAVQGGHPVIMWGVYPGGTRDSWVTPEGKEIQAWKGEHTRVIIGFTGTVEDPNRVIVLDPYAGKQYWKPTDLVSNWSGFNMSGVVVK